MLSYQGGSKSSKGRRTPTSLKSLALLELWEFCFQAMPYKGSGIHGPFWHPRSPLLTARALTHPSISQTTPTPVLHPPLQALWAPPHQPRSCLPPPLLGALSEVPDRITQQLRNLWRMDYQAAIKWESRSLRVGVSTGTTSALIWWNPSKLNTHRDSDPANRFQGIYPTNTQRSVK